jgi:hypothetical protein
MLRTLIQRVGLFTFAGFSLICTSGLLRGSVLMNEQFGYADGELRTVGSATWTRSSGTSNDLLVSSGKLLINDTNNDDATGTFIGSASVNSGKIFASFTLLGDPADVSTSGTGSDWFASFGSGTSLYTRIFPGHPVAAAAGTYRLGVTNTAASASSTFLAMDLSPTTAYQIVIRFDYSTNQSTLWVNPTSESDPNNIVATDAITPGAINKFGVRQPGASPMGDYSIDNLLVGTTFAEVVPEPGTIAMLLVAGSMLLGRRRA